MWSKMIIGLSSKLRVPGENGLLFCISAKYDLCNNTKTATFNDVTH